ncbi:MULTISPECIES: hypothetical protein [Bacillus cereus group]|uniref:hypothetical protein n=1 Tax=Bacillus cereus group TaxID=86661 RepID=UPI001F5A8326|nr:MULTISPECIES: hypothetical protein [unclassified Bacillus cereus group]
MKLNDERLYLQKSRVFNSFLNKQENKLKNLVVYLDVIFPMIFSYEKNDEIYLSYVLTCDEFERELNIISTKVPDYSILEQLADSKISLFEVFDREYDSYCTFFGMKERKIFNSKLTLGSSCDEIPTLNEFHDDDYLVEDLLPEEDFYVTRHTVNKLNLNEAKRYVQLLKLNRERTIEYKMTNFHWELIEPKKVVKYEEIVRKRLLMNEISSEFQKVYEYLGKSQELKKTGMGEFNRGHNEKDKFNVKEVRW